MGKIEDDTMVGKAADALRWWRQLMHQRDFEMMRIIY
jgi:hypothetical protein